MTASFAAFEQEFIQFTSEIVLCTVTTVSPDGRPRSRMLHPLWQVIDDRPVGWIATSKTPVKVRHLAANPYIACSYWSPAQNVVYIDCVARWVEDLADKQYVWDAFMTTPPPVGYDLSGYGADGVSNPLFAPLRLDPWRVQIMRGEEFPLGNLTPRMWRADGNE